VSPQIEVAKAVATMLDGKTVGGETLSVTPGRLLPKYETTDLQFLRVDAVPGSSATLSRVSRGTLSETCPIVIGVQKQCDVTLDETEYAKLRDVAALVATTEIDGYGTPVEDVEFRDDPASVDEEGVFRGFVATSYQAFA
jgi:hypothetical protein